MRGRVRGGVEERGIGARAAEGEAIGQGLPGRIEAQGIGPDEAPVAAQAPAVVEEAGGEALAPGMAAEDEHLGGQQAGTGGELDVEAAPQPGAVEEDGFLRQPFEGGAGFRPEARGDAGVGAEGAVELLGSGGAERGGGALPQLHRDAQRVAAGQAAGGVDQGGERRFAGLRPGEEDAQRGGLMEMAQHGAGHGDGCRPGEGEFRRALGPLVTDGGGHAGRGRQGGKRGFGRRHGPDRYAMPGRRP